jgi:hypothetical protein
LASVTLVDRNDYNQFQPLLYQVATSQLPAEDIARPLRAIVACLGHGGGGHTTWHCRACDQTVYGPPLNTHCTALDGPATVRISNLT